MATCCNHNDNVEKKFKNTEFTFITHVWACDHDSTEWNLEVFLIQNSSRIKLMYPQQLENYKEPSFTMVHSEITCHLCSEDKLFCYVRNRRLYTNPNCEKIDFKKPPGAKKLMETLNKGPEWNHEKSVIISTIHQLMHVDHFTVNKNSNQVHLEFEMVIISKNSKGEFKIILMDHINKTFNPIAIIDFHLKQAISRFGYQNNLRRPIKIFYKDNQNQEVDWVKTEAFDTRPSKKENNDGDDLYHCVKKLSMHGHKMEKYKYHASSVEVQVNEKVPNSMSQFFNKVIMSDNMPTDIKSFAHMMAADNNKDIADELVKYFNILKDDDDEVSSSSNVNNNNAQHSKKKNSKIKIDKKIVMDGGDGIFDNVTIKLSEGKMALDSNSNDIQKLIEEKFFDGKFVSSADKDCKMFSMADLNERNMVLKAKINGKPVKTNIQDHKQNGGGKASCKKTFSSSTQTGESFHQQIIMDKLTHAIADKIKSSVSNGSASSNVGVKSSGSSGSKIVGSSGGKNINKNGFVSKSAHQDLLIKKLSDKVVATKMAQEKQDGVLDDLIAMYDGPMKEIKKKGKLGEFLKMKKQAESLRKVSDENLVNVQMNFHHKCTKKVAKLTRPRDLLERKKLSYRPNFSHQLMFGNRGDGIELPSDRVEWTPGGRLCSLPDFCLSLLNQLHDKEEMLLKSICCNNNDDCYPETDTESDDSDGRPTDYQDYKVFRDSMGIQKENK